MPTKKRPRGLKMAKKEVPDSVNVVLNDEVLRDAIEFYVNAFHITPTAAARSIMIEGAQALKEKGRLAEPRKVEA